MKNFKEKWGIESNIQLTVIFIVFAVTGSTSVKLSSPLIEWVGISSEETFWLLYWPLNILITFILYQVLLVTFGTVFGQHSFFWRFEKKMLSRFGIDLDKSRESKLDEHSK